MGVGILLFIPVLLLKNKSKVVFWHNRRAIMAFAVTFVHHLKENKGA
jgi:hypothetical protein